MREEPVTAGCKLTAALLLLLLLQDPFLAEMLQNNKDQIVCYHEHDSLLDHKEEEALSEEDRKAAWAEYEAEKKVGERDGRSARDEGQRDIRTGAVLI